MTNEPGSPFKDRKILLTVFGALEIAGGILCLALIPFMLLGQFAARQLPHAQTQLHTYPMRFLLGGMLVYLFLGAGLIWLGIGSIQAKRWARALLLTLSWMALITGSLSMLLFITHVGEMRQLFEESMKNAMAKSSPAFTMPPAFITMIIVFMCVFNLVLYVLIPGVLILVYGRTDVRLTCESRYAATSWTDHCPLPVLGIVLLHAYILPASLLSFCYHFILPVFGHVLSGPAGAAGYFLITAVLLALAYGLYHQNPWAWYGSICVSVLGAASGIVTLRHLDWLVLLQQMGMPAETLTPSMQVLMKSYCSPWMVGLWFAVYTAYLIWLRPFFFRKTAI